MRIGRKFLPLICLFYHLLSHSIFFFKYSFVIFSAGRQVYPALLLGIQLSYVSNPLWVQCGQLACFVLRDACHFWVDAWRVRCDSACSLFKSGVVTNSFWDSGYNLEWQGWTDIPGDPQWLCSMNRKRPPFPSKPLCLAAEMWSCLWLWHNLPGWHKNWYLEFWMLI